MSHAPCSESFEVETLKGIEAIVDRFSRADTIISIDENDLRELMGDTQDALTVTGTGHDLSALVSLAEHSLEKLRNAGVPVSTKGIFFEIVADKDDLPLWELTKSAEAVTSMCDEDAIVLWSSRIDPQLGDRVKITIASPIL
jgi:cell division protein FtsZ